MRLLLLEILKVDCFQKWSAGTLEKWKWKKNAVSIISTLSRVTRHHLWMTSQPNEF